MDGVYCFGFKLFVQSDPVDFRVGIYKNNAVLAFGGRNGAMTEALTILTKCSAGDIVGC